MDYTYDKAKGEFVLDVVLPTQEEIRKQVSEQLPFLEEEAGVTQDLLNSLTTQTQDAQEKLTSLQGKIASIKEGLGIKEAV